MAISWVPRGLSCCLRLGTPESCQGLSGEPGKSEGQGCRLLFPLERKGMGRSKPCIPVPSSNLGSGSAGASQGAPPARPLLVGPATLYQGNLPAFLGWPGQSSHYLTSLSSSYVRPRARLGHPRLQLGHGSRLPNRVALRSASLDPSQASPSGLLE